MDKIKVFRGIYWFAEERNRKIGIKVMRRYEKKREIAIAMAMMKRFPIATDKFINMKHDIVLKHKNKLIVATPPRIYEDWIYDFLKSDICVVGTAKKEKKIFEKFYQLKEVSENEKKKLNFYLGKIQEALDRIASKKLISAMIGRGSYFEKNGFPEKDENLNFILILDLRRNSPSTINRIYKERSDEIKEGLKEIPYYTVKITVGAPRSIKEGSRKVVDFIILPMNKKYVRNHAKGIKYEKYVLLNGVGIDLPHLPKNKSEKIAIEFAQMLPKRKNRKNIPALPPAKGH
jgi:hypothetical protein